MHRPQRYLIRTIIFLTAVILILASLHKTLTQAFITNPGLNGVIAAVLLIGIIFSIRKMIGLFPCVDWINHFRANPDDHQDNKAPEMLAPFITLMTKDNNTHSLSTQSMDSLLDSTAARMDETREITSYLIGLLVFLGLIGTFWGLLGTIGSIKGIIDSLSVTSTDVSALFEDLKNGLAAPLGGMGTAFSSSLFGLAGSVVLGFIQLQTSQAQNRFLNDLEDYLSSITNLSRSSSSVLTGDGGSMPSYMVALLEQNTDNMDKLQKIISRSESNRSDTTMILYKLSEQLSELSDSQQKNNVLFQKMTQEISQNSASSDSTDFGRKNLDQLQNIGAQLKYLTDETIKGQDELNDQLRGEFKLLSKTLGASISSAVQTNTPKETPHSRPHLSAPLRDEDPK